MLTNRPPLEVPGELDPKPTDSYSFATAFAKPFYELAGFAKDIAPSLSTEASRKSTADKIDVANNIISDPRNGSVQNGLNDIGLLAGSIAPTIPLAAAAGLATEAGLGVLGSALESAAPEELSAFARTPVSDLTKSSLSKYLPESSVGKTATHIASSFAGYKAAVLPEHVVENYNKNTDTLNVQDTIKDWSSDNLGYLMASAPFFAGGLLMKALRVRGEVKASRLLANHENVQASRIANPEAEIVPTNLEKRATESLNKGLITKDEHDWYQSYLKDPNDPKLKDDANALLKPKLPANLDTAAGHVWFELLSKNDIEGLKSAIREQVGNDFGKPEGQALTDYILKNASDRVRDNLINNPEFKDGLQGYTEILDRKLSKKPALLKIADKFLKDNVFDKHPELESLHKDVVENIKNDFTNSDSYKKLLDHPNAVEVLSRINIEHEYNKQRALSNVIKSFVQFADSNAARQADPNTVIKYLQRKINSTLPDKENDINNLEQEIESRDNKHVSELNNKENEKNNTPEFIKEVQESVKSLEAKKLSNDFELSSKRLKQFQDKKNELNELIDCAQGSFYG